MWIVKIALQRSYTFIVLAIIIVLLGGYAIAKTATDIFPNIKIPVAAVIWRYSGLLPEEMANRIVLFSERIAQTTVNDVEHTESQSVNSTAVVKYFFQPDVDPDLSFAQITAVSQTELFFAPPGTPPPFVLAYNASSVPILQLALSSDSLPEAKLYDLGNTILRTQLATIAGASIPFPYGGKQRQVQVDLDPQQLRANGLSGNDVVKSIGEQNLILPAGTQKIDSFEYFIKVNASPTQIDDLNNMPVRAQNGTVTYVRDVAHVRDGYAPQTNMVRVDGRRAVLMNVLKTGNASTIDIIDGIKQKLPQIRTSLPPELKIAATSDQSVFVRSAIDGVIREAVIAAALTGLLILLFLGSWRSTLIITISIPLSILASIACLSAIGQTINIMTLGGLALAVGILVDDATVTIENINYHLESGKDVQTAILDGAQQIALPALVSTLCICIVFIPMFLLAGIAKFLFIPLAEAVVFAMLASYVLSRTLVPTLAKFWLKAHDPQAHARSTSFLARWQRAFERGFAAARDRYKNVLQKALNSGPRFVVAFLACMAAACLLAFPLGPFPGLGQDFFPSVDGGQIKLHMRTQSGTRIEETAALCDAVEATIREMIPASEIINVVDNIGLPYSGINLAYSTSAPIGPADADIYVNLTQHHKPTANYVQAMRAKLAATYPSSTFAFLPADMIGQILNFGLPSPIDVQIVGFNTEANREVANRLLQKLRSVPGAVDLHIHQAGDYPQFNVDVDRSKAELLGVTEEAVASNLLVSLSGSFQTSPSFWVDPKGGTQYQVVAQTPQYRLQNLNDLGNTPLNGTRNSSQILSNLISIHRSAAPAVVSHYNATPSIDIYGSVQGADLGFVSAEIEKVVAQAKKDLPRGSNIVIRGQVQTMKASFNGLLIGLVGAIVLVYLLIVINFQSWLDPFIIITALPAALAGIVWMLFLTGTTVSVPALMGAIMCMGVATANSVLVISFARERMQAGETAFEAALQAGFTRLRPVVMTATAMIIGMIPMALGLGEGGEQNAPLGRAVIGGLIFATVATLIFVPTVFSIIHGRRSPDPVHNVELSHG
ncbi:MAG TPA: efflux RND transporter permease subunit [Steroidobacteraceae bacterium]|jgi:CzcA family heavy metal efflux pump|nr:efflux RND transporter permease subunit [Steroidobacteraceae bacterium]